MCGPTVSGKHARARALDVDPLLAVVDEVVDAKPAPSTTSRRRSGGPPREVTAGEPVVVGSPW